MEKRYYIDGKCVLSYDDDVFSTDDDYSSCLQSENDEMRQRSNDNSEIQFEGRNISVAEYLYDSVFGSAVVNI